MWDEGGKHAVAYAVVMDTASPPPYQVVVIPHCSRQASEAVAAYASQLAADLQQAGLHAHADLRPSHVARWKFTWWEQRGVPFRIQVGGRPMAKGRVVVADCRGPSVPGALNRTRSYVEIDRTQVVAYLYADMKNQSYASNSTGD